MLHICVVTNHTLNIFIVKRWRQWFFLFASIMILSVMFFNDARYRPDKPTQFFSLLFQDRQLNSTLYILSSSLATSGGNSLTEHRVSSPRSRKGSDRHRIISHCNINLWNLRQLLLWRLTLVAATIRTLFQHLTNFFYKYCHSPTHGANACRYHNSISWRLWRQCFTLLHKVMTPLPVRQLQIGNLFFTLHVIPQQSSSNHLFNVPEIICYKPILDFD